MSTMSNFSLEDSPSKSEKEADTPPVVRLLVRFDDNSKFVKLNNTSLDRNFKNAL